MQIAPVLADAPCMQRALAFIGAIFKRQEPQVMRPTMKEPERRRDPGPQQLGPKQLAWLEDRFKFYGIHRKQAEAPTGVAVVQPDHRS